ncbi:MAG: helix-hairpin-helix domain-containing protein [Planctomycetota bacterium]
MATETPATESVATKAAEKETPASTIAQVATPEVETTHAEATGADGDNEGRLDKSVGMGFGWFPWGLFEFPQSVEESDLDGPFQAESSGPANLSLSDTSPFGDMPPFDASLMADRTLENAVAETTKEVGEAMRASVAPVRQEPVVAEPAVETVVEARSQIAHNALNAEPVIRPSVTDVVSQLNDGNSRAADAVASSITTSQAEVSDSDSVTEKSIAAAAAPLDSKRATNTTLAAGRRFGWAWILAPLSVLPFLLTWLGSREGKQEETLHGVPQVVDAPAAGTSAESKNHLMATVPAGADKTAVSRSDLPVASAAAATGLAAAGLTVSASEDGCEPGTTSYREYEATLPGSAAALPACDIQSGGQIETAASLAVSRPSGNINQMDLEIESDSKEVETSQSDQSGSIASTIGKVTRNNLENVALDRGVYDRGEQVEMDFDDCLCKLIGSAACDSLRKNGIVRIEDFESMDDGQLQQILTRHDCQFDAGTLRWELNQYRFVDSFSPANDVTSDAMVRVAGGQQEAVGFDDYLQTLLGRETCVSLRQEGICSFDDLELMEDDHLQRILARHDCDLDTETLRWQRQQRNFDTTTTSKDFRFAINKQIASSTRKDDLTKIRGIGQATAEILESRGITTLRQISIMSPREIDDLLDAASSNFALVDPTTWPAQAKQLLSAVDLEEQVAALSSTGATHS